MFTGRLPNNFTFDGTGNRTAYTTGTGNRLTTDGVYTYTYDDEGNVTKKSKAANDETYTYGYDHRNQMTWMEKRATDGGTLQKRAEYAYDVHGNRVERKVDNDGNATWDGIDHYALDGWQPGSGFVGNENWDVWADLSSSNVLQTRYLRGDVIDQLFARTEMSGDVYWLLTDRQGSTRNVIDADGDVVDTIAYDGYGNVVTESAPTLGGRYKWQGREYDAETQFLYHRARYYEARVGRWTSQDPLGFGAGDSNLYRYVMNRPANRTDPSGLQQAGTTPFFLNPKLSLSPSGPNVVDLHEFNLYFGELNTLKNATKHKEISDTSRAYIEWLLQQIEQEELSVVVPIDKNAPIGVPGFKGVVKSKEKYNSFRKEVNAVVEDLSKWQAQRFKNEWDAKWKYHPAEFVVGFYWGFENTLELIARPDKTLEGLGQLGSALWEDPVGTPIAIASAMASEAYHHPLKFVGSAAFDAVAAKGLGKAKAVVAAPKAMKAASKADDLAALTKKLDSYKVKQPGKTLHKSPKGAASGPNSPNLAGHTLGPTDWARITDPLELGRLQSYFDDINPGIWRLTTGNGITLATHIDDSYLMQLSRAWGNEVVQVQLHNGTHWLGRGTGQSFSLPNHISSVTQIRRITHTHPGIGNLDMSFGIGSDWDGLNGVLGLQNHFDSPNLLFEYRIISQQVINTNGTQQIGHVSMTYSMNTLRQIKKHIDGGGAGSQFVRDLVNNQIGELPNP